MRTETESGVLGNRYSKLGKLFIRISLISISLISASACKTVAVKQITAADYEKSFVEKHHDVKLVLNGQDALHERVALIRSARSTIEIQTFVWFGDESGKVVYHELVKAAERGVTVRIICDHFTVREDFAQLISGFRTDGLELRIYNPVSNNIIKPKGAMLRSMITEFSRFNKRMHNKVMVVDGEIGICGGRNISNKYYGESEKTNHKDMEIIVRGPIAKSMAASFEDYWQSSLSKDIHQFEDVKNAKIGGRLKRSDLDKIEEGQLYKSLDQALSDPVYLSHLSSGYTSVNKIAYVSDEAEKNAHAKSFYGSSRLNELLAYSIMNARKSMLIQTPYLILSSRARYRTTLDHQHQVSRLPHERAFAVSGRQHHTGRQILIIHLFSQLIFILDHYRPDRFR